MADGGSVFVLRAFTYTCAFVGAGWFGDWVYQFGWSSISPDIYFIVGLAVVAGVLAAKQTTRTVRS